MDKNIKVLMVIGSLTLFTVFFSVFNSDKKTCIEEQITTYIDNNGYSKKQLTYIYSDCKK